MKKIELKTEVNRDKSVSIRLSLLRIDDENPDDVMETFHRITLRPGDDLAFFRAENERHLAQPFSVSGIKGAPWPKIPDEEWVEVEQIVSILHTPERIAKRVADDQKRLTNAAQTVRK